MKGAHTSFVSSCDGTRIAYDVTGYGPALVLLHGAGKTRRDWHKTGYVNRLQEDFTVACVDLRGSGESDILTGIPDYTIEKLCDDINTVIDACGFQRVLIWGYSFGGNIARYLGAWSSRVAAIAVIGVPFGPAVDDDFEIFIRGFLAKWQPVVEANKEGTISQAEQKSVIKSRIPVWVACFQAMRSWPSIMPEDLRCPSLLLSGTENHGAFKWVQGHSEALERARVQVEVIEGLNHSQEFSEIERVFPSVSSFCRRHAQV